MKNAIPATETLTREERLTMLADTMMAQAAELHKVAMALKSEIKESGLAASMTSSVVKRNSKIKIVSATDR
jgi:hypothetical protein